MEERNDRQVRHHMPFVPFAESLIIFFSPAKQLSVSLSPGNTVPASTIVAFT
jgi:hypothetical protein